MPQNDNLWRDMVKTLFDPCPARWRVPRSGEEKFSPWSEFSENNGTFQSTSAATTGRMWPTPPVYNGNCWLPSSGYRHAGTSYFTTCGENGYLWSASVPQNVRAYTLSNYSNVTRPSGAHHARGTGIPIRCVRE